MKTTFIESPFFQWLAAAIGVLLYALLRTTNVIDVDSWQASGLNPEAAIGVCYLVSAIFTLRSLVRHHFFPRVYLYLRSELYFEYFDNGDFRGYFVYEAQNRSRQQLHNIPTDGFLWANAVKSKDIQFRPLYKDGTRPHRFLDASPEVTDYDQVYDRALGAHSVQLSWTPALEPPIEPDEHMLYEVEVFTPATELDAFTERGTSLGFPTTIFTDDVELTARAPSGYQFQLRSPAITVLEQETGANLPKEEKRVPMPTISADGSRLTWRLQ